MANRTNEQRLSGIIDAFYFYFLLLSCEGLGSICSICYEVTIPLTMILPRPDTRLVSSFLDFTAQTTHKILI